MLSLFLALSQQGESRCTQELTHSPFGFPFLVTVFLLEKQQEINATNNVNLKLDLVYLQDEVRSSVRSNEVAIFRSFKGLTLKHLSGSFSL